MAKAAKKSAKEASNIFHNIMKASVSSTEKALILKIEKYLTSADKEMNDLGSTLSEVLKPKEREEMVSRLNNLKKGKFGVSGKRIERL